MADKKRSSFRLDLGEPLATRLSEYCKAHFLNKTGLIRKLIKEFLDRHEPEKPIKTKKKTGT